eukprot:CAMPEP_0172930952 /NCGR_PEP_ID=MMETSP1075-20121228/219250_1 /TAXON_ID=2916 /ORGANISM="Ceratium fusus, Strain PA161109" /LENGTH=249 /DNA_ID=CAMNT_0013792265 /DNA_START=170 /DNA_END=919 /DNA_ORIENTATION=-
MCCGAPYFECVEKNKATTKDGEFVAAYAQCRFANNSAGKSSCPCKNPPCRDYAHDYQVKGPKLPWSCVVLTGGCSPAFKGCGPGKGLDEEQKKNWNQGPPCCQWGCTCNYSVAWTAQDEEQKKNWNQGPPCCQWGCTCNYSVAWTAQCQPPEGLYACTKDAQKSVHKDQGGKGGEEKDDDDDDSSSNRFFSTDEEAPRLQHAGSFPWLAAGASVALLVTGIAMVLRKRRIERGSYHESPMFTEADTESS